MWASEQIAIVRMLCFCGNILDYNLMFAKNMLTLKDI